MFPPLLLRGSLLVSPGYGFLVGTGDFPAASGELKELNVQNEFQHQSKRMFMQHVGISHSLLIGVVSPNLF